MGGVLPGHLPDGSVRDVACGGWKGANASAAFRRKDDCIHGGIAARNFLQKLREIFGWSWKRHVSRLNRVRAAQATRPVADRGFQGP